MYESNHTSLNIIDTLRILSLKRRPKAYLMHKEKLLIAWELGMDKKNTGSCKNDQQVKRIMRKFVEDFGLLQCRFDNENLATISHRYVFCMKRYDKFVFVKLYDF